MTPSDKRRLCIVVEAPASEIHHRLKAALKVMLRRFGLRCTRIATVEPMPDAPNDPEDT